MLWTETWLCSLNQVPGVYSQNSARMERKSTISTGNPKCFDMFRSNPGRCGGDFNPSYPDKSSFISLTQVHWGCFLTSRSLVGQIPYFSRRSPGNPAVLGTELEMAV